MKKREKKQKYKGIRLQDNKIVKGVLEYGIGACIGMVYIKNKKGVHAVCEIKKIYGII